jgi:hypothetical protein
MATTLFLNGERTAVAQRPVARWVPEPGPDGRTRLVMVWSVPAPVVPRQASAA